MGWNLEDKVCLVTGGAAGVGAAIARVLLSENALHVAFLDIAAREGATLETELNNKFGALRAKFIKCDIANEEQLRAAYEQVVDKYRRLDVVINNAAILSADARSYTRMVGVNFTATVNSTFKALEIMRADRGGRGGVVVNISSLLAFTLNTQLPVYAATKTAVLHFSNCIGMQQQESGSCSQVRVITVCLGPTDTAILHRHNIQKPDELPNNDCEQCITSRTAERQRVESAAKGTIDVMKRGESGSNWRIANDLPPEDITDNVKKGYDVLSLSMVD